MYTVEFMPTTYCLTINYEQKKKRHTTQHDMTSSKVIIVTGASRGLGLAISKLILQKSTTSKVVLVARSANRLQEFKTQAPPQHQSRILTIQGDITEQTTIESIVTQTLSTFGQIDSIIFNAGVLEPVQHISDINIESLKQLFNVNFFSIVALTQAALPHLRQTHGSCVFVSSGASTTPYDAWSAYGSSKAALNLFNASVAAEESGVVKSVSVAPGVVDTEMQTDIRETFGVNMKPSTLKRFIDLKESGGLLKPEVPGSVYANLALRGIPDELNGKYVRYNSALLKEFLEE